MTSATIGLFRKSSTCYLLLLRAKPLGSQVLPGQACVERIGVGDLQQYIARRLILPAHAKVLRQVAQDLPVGPRTRQRSQSATNSLDVMIDVGHASLFFSKGNSGRHPV